MTKPAYRTFSPFFMDVTVRDPAVRTLVSLSRMGSAGDGVGCVNSCDNPTLPLRINLRIQRSVCSRKREEKAIPAWHGQPAARPRALYIYPGLSHRENPLRRARQGRLRLV